MVNDLNIHSISVLHHENEEMLQKTHNSRDVTLVCEDKR